MSRRFFIFLLNLLFCLKFGAQSKADYEQRLRNCYFKLYENPGTALNAARELQSEPDNIAVQAIINKALLLQGNFSAATQLLYGQEAVESPGRKLLLAQLYHSLNLFQQTANLLDSDWNDETAALSENRRAALLALLYQMETQNFLTVQQTEKAKHSLKNSKKYAVKSGAVSPLMQADNSLLEAEIALQSKEDSVAEKLAEAVAKKYKGSRQPYLYARAQELRAEIAFKKRQYDAAVRYLQLALQALGDADYLPLKTKIYGNLATNFLALKDNDAYREFQQKSSENMEILEKNQKDARRELLQLRTAYSTAQNEAAAKRFQLQFGLFALILFLALGTLAAFYFREIQRAKNLTKQIRFFRLHPALPQTATEKDSEKTQRKQLFIPEDTERDLLIKLEEFEDSQKYLDNSMSLPSLAAHLETNTKYLSEIIKKYKNKNFNSYINELRVQHVINLLRTDRAYLQYKISYIAEIGGFTSHSAFTNVFKSITGMSPNDFMQTLKSESQ